VIHLLLLCPMCFGDADSDQVRSAKIGVLVLLGFIVPLLLAIGFTARSWARRARQLDARQSPASSETLTAPQSP